MRTVRKEIGEQKKSVLADMTELEDVMAASIQDVRVSVLTAPTCACSRRVARECPKVRANRFSWVLTLTGVFA
eukprot:2734126-Pyramimonas_sp.AAC.2